MEQVHRRGDCGLRDEAGTMLCVVSAIDNGNESRLVLVCISHSSDPLPVAAACSLGREGRGRGDPKQSARTNAQSLWIVRRGHLESLR